MWLYRYHRFDCKAFLFRIDESTSKISGVTILAPTEDVRNVNQQDINVGSWYQLPFSTDIPAPLEKGGKDKDTRRDPPAPMQIVGIKNTSV